MEDLFPPPTDAEIAERQKHPYAIERQKRINARNAERDAADHAADAMRYAYADPARYNGGLRKALAEGKRKYGSDRE